MSFGVSKKDPRLEVNTWLKNHIQIQTLRFENEYATNHWASVEWWMSEQLMNIEWQGMQNLGLHT